MAKIQRATSPLRAFDWRARSCNTTEKPPPPLVPPILSDCPHPDVVSGRCGAVRRENREVSTESEAKLVSSSSNPRVARANTCRDARRQDLLRVRDRGDISQPHSAQSGGNDHGREPRRETRSASSQHEMRLPHNPQDAVLARTRPYRQTQAEQISRAVVEEANVSLQESGEFIRGHGPCVERALTVAPARIASVLASFAETELGAPYYFCRIEISNPGNSPSVCDRLQA